MTQSIDRDHPSQVRALRRFNRFYAAALEAMEGELVKDFSMAEMRVLYELAYRPETPAKELAERLAMDPGYLSRLLNGLARRRLIARTRSEQDARLQHLSLTKQGIAAFRKLDAAANERIGDVLKQITPARRRRLMAGIAQVGKAMESRGEATPPILFRPPKPGDFGWIIYRHGTVISEEFGWDGKFEHMITDILSEFTRNYDAASDRAIIAEHDGEVVGSVFLVRDDAVTAKLRVLYVEPHARGFGLGRKLVEKAIREARKIGYKRIVLWTARGLDSARRIYENAGFTLIEETPHHEFTSTKHETVGQIWALHLPETTATD